MTIPGQNGPGQNEAGEVPQLKILVLCTGNSCRSQMAEGFLRHMAGDQFEVHSAGIDPADRVHPLAVNVMAEVGIDISEQRPQGLKEYLGRILVRYLIIVCDDAQQQCPRIFPGVSERLFWPFADPARFVGSQDETLAVFRRIRDEIHARILEWLEQQPTSPVNAADRLPS